MRDARPRRLRLVFGLLCLAYSLVLPRPCHAGDITVFGARGYPQENWSTGYGAALSFGFLGVLSFEGEAARMPGKASDESMYSFTASALLAPPVGPLTPYGGLGVGLFRQAVGDKTDTGRLNAFILGLKLKLAGVLVVKGEYRRIPVTSLLPMNHRLSAGAGISF